MPDSLPSTIGEGELQRASWAHLPDAGLFQSWKRQDDELGLLEGAYFGLNGDPIVDVDERIYIGPGGSILLHNPGLRKISRFLPDVFAGRLLALLDADGIPKKDITFPEAENEGLIQLRSYIDAWKYIGKESANLFTRIHIGQKRVPSEVYQVTKRGVGKIAVTARDIQRPSVLRYFGLRPRI